jgi:hypothetical protein
MAPELFLVDKAITQFMLFLWTLIRDLKLVFMSESMHYFPLQPDVRVKDVYRQPCTMNL